MHLFTEFDSPCNTFFAGQHVTGRLVVKIQETKRFENIIMVCKGSAHVSWSEPDSSLENNDTRDYEAQKEYFRHTQIVAGNTGPTKLNPGEYRYAFDFLLPPSIPSSFEGTHGYIRYTVKAVMHRQSKLFGYDFKIPITVLSTLDLNKISSVKKPVIRHVSDTFRNFFKSGLVKMIVELPWSGFVPGETIPFKIAVENRSGVVVNSVNCCLKKKEVYTAASRKKAEKNVVANILIDEKTEPNNSKRFLRGMKIPPLPPSELPDCSIIELKYFCKVKADVGWGRRLKVKIPLTLGTVPLNRSPNTSPDSSINSSTNSSSVPRQISLPLPTYQKCVIPKTRQFVPHYPVWSLD